MNEVKALSSIFVFFEDVVPLEFCKRPSFYILWGKFFEYATNSLQNNSILFMLKEIFFVLNILVLNTFVSSILQDKYLCNLATSVSDCGSNSTWDVRYRFCSWDPLTSTCAYNVNTDTNVQILMYAVIIIIVMYPVNKLLNIWIQYCSIVFLYQKEAKYGDHRVIPYDYSNKKIDRNMMTVPAKVMLSARIEAWTKQNSYEDELHVLEQTAGHFYISRRYSLSIHVMIEIVEYLLSKEQQARGRGSRRYFRCLTNPADEKQVLLHRLFAAMAYSTSIIKHVAYLEDQRSQEIYLFRSFIVDLFTGWRRSMVLKYFIRNIHLKSFSNLRPTVTHYISLLLFSVYLVVEIGVLYYLGVPLLSSPKAQIFTYTPVIVLYLLIFIIIPLRAYIIHVLLPSAIHQEVYSIIQDLKDRMKMILRRRTGMIRNDSMLLQYFNGGCRAARRFPRLPAARFLMALNDYDIPTYANSRKKSCSKRLKSFMIPLAWLGSYVALAVTALPDIMLEMLLNITFLVLVTSAALSLYVYQNDYFLYTIGGLLVLILLVMTITFILYARLSYAIEKSLLSPDKEKLDIPKLPDDASPSADGLGEDYQTGQEGRTVDFVARDGGLETPDGVKTGTVGEDSKRETVPWTELPAVSNEGKTNAELISELKESLVPHLGPEQLQEMTIQQRLEERRKRLQALRQEAALIAPIVTNRNMSSTEKNANATSMFRPGKHRLLKALKSTIEINPKSICLSQEMDKDLDDQEWFEMLERQTSETFCRQPSGVVTLMEYNEELCNELVRLSDNSEGCEHSIEDYLPSAAQPPTSQSQQLLEQSVEEPELLESSEESRQQPNITRTSAEITRTSAEISPIANRAVSSPAENRRLGSDRTVKSSSLPPASPPANQKATVTNAFQPLTPSFGDSTSPLKAYSKGMLVASLTPEERANRVQASRRPIVRAGSQVISG